MRHLNKAYRKLANSRRITRAESNLLLHILKIGLLETVKNHQALQCVLVLIVCKSVTNFLPNMDKYLHIRYVL